jgi:UDP-N-acetylglucosamine--N-acetylmuramyl-(pentapeptide) pyrophosphoryl-undecaprenol N-acetylglucosamine transferase
VGAITEMRTFRVALAGGGTAGHLFPGLAIARALEVHAGRSTTWLFGTGRVAEARGLAGSGVRLELLPAPRPPRRRAALAAFALRLGRAWFAARRRLRALAPDVLIGLGGYASVAPGLAAHSLGIPLFLLEQNALPGKAVRLLAPRARRTFVPWEETATSLGERAACDVLGNPVRAELWRARPEARYMLGLRPEAPTLLVMGGSQGAQAINRAVRRALPQLASAGGRSGRAQVIHLAGDDDVARLAAAYRAAGIRAHVTPFLADMGAAYAAADLALCRAGGTTIAELAACGLPAVLVPYPHAADDHQRANARAAARQGGALVMEEAALVEGGLHGVIALLGDGARRGEMRRSLDATVGREAAARIARRVWEVMAE